MSFIKITEQDSHYRHLEKMSILELLTNINTEDKKVAIAVEQVIPSIEKLVSAAAKKMKNGGKLFYIGAGTSGRLGILDASECPPTYGVSPELVIGIIAGGNKAITQAVEFAEDDELQAWRDLQTHKINTNDFVIGLASSGSTPYVKGALQNCKMNGISTGSICCNPSSPVSDFSDFPVEVIVGPEFVTGSTRMKSGTAQKMILNMISTSIMIHLGRVEDNKMVNMQLTNDKLIERGTKIIMEQKGISDYTKAKHLLLNFGSIKKAMEQ